jgi:hypothetical protein
MPVFKVFVDGAIGIEQSIGFGCHALPLQLRRLLSGRYQRHGAADSAGVHINAVGHLFF